MSYKKISFTFATILFISLLNLIYSNSWERADSETGFDPDETVYAGNKIGVKYKSKTQYTTTHEFKVSSIIGHNSIWAAYVYIYDFFDFNLKTPQNQHTQQNPTIFFTYFLLKLIYINSVLHNK